MSLTRQDWWKILLGAAVSLFSLAVIIYFIDISRLVQALQLADYRYVGLLFGITLIWLIVRAMVWRALLQNEPKYGDVFLAMNEGYLLNNVLPLRLGEVGRAFLLGRKAQLPFFHVFSTVLIERGMDLGFAAGLLLVTLPFVVGTEIAGEIAVLVSAAVAIGLIGLHILARNRDWALKTYERLAERFTWFGKLIGRRQVGAFFDGLGALTDARRFGMVLLLMTLNWGIAIVQFYVLLLAFFPQARLLWVGFTLGVMALGAAAPSSPGAVGVLEVSVMGALSAFGVDPSAALAAALLAHLTNYSWTGIFGSYGLLRDGLSLGSVFRDLRSVSPAVDPDQGV